VTSSAGGTHGRPADSRPPVAEAIGVGKTFGRTRVLDDVTLSVLPGECHALVGRNGAGKSTLVAILTGLFRPDGGTIALQGEEPPGLGDRAAWQKRVACVYQRSMVVPTLSVAENVFLNHAGRRFVSWRAIRSQARRVTAEWGFDLDVTMLASELSVEERQIVEIVRALSVGARFLILDEPTAALEAGAVQRLFEHVRRLKASGVGVLYISHHLEEVYEICERATVLRDGKHIVTAPVAELDHEQLVAAMVGAALARTERSESVVDAAEPPRLTVAGLTVGSQLGSVEDLSLEVRPGECLGLFGLRGSGAVAVADAVAGLLRPAAGEILVDGAPLPPGRVDRALARGVGYVPEDRHLRGFVSTMGVRENLTLTILDQLAHWGCVARSRAAAAAGPLALRLQIVSAGDDQPVGELSGGNQQKVVVGRALASAPSVLVVVSPTVGVDVASKEALLGVVDEARADGMAVLLVSDDLDELRICTRILAIRRGRIVREFADGSWDRHELIAAAEGLGAAA
jgi:simple sugar transport system ATP-binding protein